MHEMLLLVKSCLRRTVRCSQHADLNMTDKLSPTTFRLLVSQKGSRGHIIAVCLLEQPKYFIYGGHLANLVKYNYM